MTRTQRHLLLAAVPICAFCFLGLHFAYRHTYTYSICNKTDKELVLVIDTTGICHHDNYNNLFYLRWEERLDTATMACFKATLSPQCTVTMLQTTKQNVASTWRSKPFSFFDIWGGNRVSLYCEGQIVQRWERPQKPEDALDGHHFYNESAWCCVYSGKQRMNVHHIFTLTEEDIVERDTSFACK